MKQIKCGKFISHVLYTATAVIALTLILFVFIRESNTSELNQSGLRQIYFTGTQQESASDTLILKGHFSGEIQRKEQLLFFINRISVQIYQNGNLVFSYGELGTHPDFTKAGGSVWGSFYSAGIKKSDDITLILHNVYRKDAAERYGQFLNRIYAGDKMELFRKLLTESSFKAAASTMIFILGAVLLMAALTLMIMRADVKKSIYDCGILFLTAGVWLLADSIFISLWIPFGSAFDVLETLTLLGMIPLTIHYINHFTVSRARYILTAIEYFYIIVILVYACLQWEGIVDGEMMQYVYFLVLPYIVSAAFLCLLTEVFYSKSTENRWIILSGLILIIFGTAGNIYGKADHADGENLLGIGLCIFALVQFIIAMHYTKDSLNKARQTKQMEAELIENRISIMMSQIQPHFLYNALSCIQELCLREPQKAHDALAQFAFFLRGNMDSLNSTQLIPIEQELCHVKNYLAIEKIRFENRLAIVYEIKAEGFFLPALTLQPIVENAVRYGISKKKRGGTVTISTKETEEAVIITIKDDGIGFDPFFDKAVNGKEGGRSHIGIENVKKRLMSQCEGTLEVKSQIEEGTTVTIRIPK